MQIKVTNRGLAEVITFGVSYIVISIYSTQSDPAKIPLHPNCMDVLPICFDDLTEDFYYVDKQGMINDLKTITEDQAKQIWTFVDCYFGKSTNNLPIPVGFKQAELLLVHCDAGVCRSPAVAAAISRIYKGEDNEWFQKPYLPNMKVYNTMLKVKGLSNEY